MSTLIYLVPIALGLGLAALASFLWSLRDGQYDDMDGAAERILFDEDDRPLPSAAEHPRLNSIFTSKESL